MKCCRTTRATLADARELAANDFKYWELMRRACERGLRVFDYGRSKRGTGSFDFKKNWGFEAAPSVLRIQASEARQHSAEQSAQPQVSGASSRCGGKLPLPLVNAIGPMLVRNLG